MKVKGIPRTNFQSKVFRTQNSSLKNTDIWSLKGVSNFQVRFFVNISLKAQLTPLIILFCYICIDRTTKVSQRQRGKYNESY
jgi:hypothetical protein